MSDDAREKLDQLSRLLLQIHKGLLLFQRLAQEGMERRQLSPNELLQALFSNPDFEWLRTISSLVARIDEVSDDKSALHAQEYEKFVREVASMFDNSDLHGDFKWRLENALQKDPALRGQISELKKMIS